MRRNQKSQGQQDTVNPEPIRSSFPALIADVAIFEHLPDLVGKRTRNRAGQIARSHGLSVSKAKKLEVLGRGASVPVATGCRCCPGGESFALSNQLQGESGVNFFNGTKADSTLGQWVHNDHLVFEDLNFWKNVVGPDQAQHEQHYGAGFNSVLTIEPNGLSHRKTGKNKARYGNYIAGSRSIIHSQILSRQETDYVAG